MRLLGNSLRQIGQPEGAQKRYNQALLIQHKISDRYGEAETLYSLAKAQQQLNDLSGSRESLTAALSIFSALGDPQADITRAELEQLRRDDHTPGT